MGATTHQMSNPLKDQLELLQLRLLDHEFLAFLHEVLGLADAWVKKTEEIQGRYITNA